LVIKEQTGTVLRPKRAEVGVIPALDDDELARRSIGAWLGDEVVAEATAERGTAEEPEN
jgi:hypothetical protein